MRPVGSVVKSSPVMDLQLTARTARHAALHSNSAISVPIGSFSLLSERMKH
jgi:hypothetical protein